MSMAWQGPIALKNHVLHGLVSLATSSRNVLYYIDYIYIYIYIYIYVIIMISMEAEKIQWHIPNYIPNTEPMHLALR